MFILISETDHRKSIKYFDSIYMEIFKLFRDFKSVNFVHSHLLLYTNNFHLTWDFEQ